MQEVPLKTGKSICSFCQTPIKNETETFLCPACNSPYHVECWIENKGCAVYGCNEKITDEESESSFRAAIINIEYLMNRNQYSEAIYEAKQLLRIEKRSSELKNLYNRAVALINNKMNLMSSGDEAFSKKDYKAAEAYYKNVLKYTDELEANFVNTRLEIIRDKIPEQNRRRIYYNILLIVLILAILSAIGYLGYYTFVLKEDREYAELVKSDKANDLKSMETMIGKYETFLREYPSGRKTERVKARIDKYSEQIAVNYFKDDWKLSLKYYSKVKDKLPSAESGDLFNKIYREAFSEYRTRMEAAKKLNSAGKYQESLNEIKNAALIVSSFPQSAIGKDTQLLERNMDILGKKISSAQKAVEVEKEIRESSKKLATLTGVSKNLVPVSARITGTAGIDLYVARETGTGANIAIRSLNEYKAGQLVNLMCYTGGKTTVEDDYEGTITVQLYMSAGEAGEIAEEANALEAEATSERLRNLRKQKTLLDSLLKLNLL